MITIYRDVEKFKYEKIKDIVMRTIYTYDYCGVYNNHID